MHEPFNPHCSHCRKFVYCFSPGGPLADWGYCEEELADGPPTEDELRLLEAAARAGEPPLRALAVATKVKRIGVI